MSARPFVGPTNLSEERSEGDVQLARLREAIRRAKVRPRRVQVGVTISVALGRERGSVSCGGCQVPLEVDGIPAETVVHLKEPFRLIVDEPTAA